MRFNPLVSIITVCLNNEKYIKQTIDSVLKQTYYNIEYIIIDGKSTDTTVKIIKEYENKFNGRMKWISEKDKGIYDAMNKGINIANGEIIGIINSGDFYVKNAVELVVSIFNFDNTINLIHGNVIKFGFKNDISFLVKGTDKHIEKRMSIQHPTCFISREIYKKYGKFDLKYKISADYELLLRFRKEGIKFYYLDKVLCYFRIGGVSSNTYKALKEVEEIHKNYRGVIYSKLTYIRNIIMIYFKKLLKELLLFFLYYSPIKFRKINILNRKIIYQNKIKFKK